MVSLSIYGMISAGTLRPSDPEGNLLDGQSAGTTNPRTGEVIAGARASGVFCFPLLSGIVGVLKSKYLSTGDMTAGDLWLEVTLAPAAYGVLGVNADPDYTVSEVEMMSDYTDLASEAARMVSRVTQAVT